MAHSTHHPPHGHGPHSQGRQQAVVVLAILFVLVIVIAGLFVILSPGALAP